MYTKEDLIEEFRQSEVPAQLREVISEEEWRKEREERLKQMLETNPEYFQQKADMRNAMEAYNKAAEAGDEAALPELERRVKQLAEKRGYKFDGARRTQQPLRSVATVKRDSYLLAGFMSIFLAPFCILTTGLLSFRHFSSSPFFPGNFPRNEPRASPCVTRHAYLRTANGKERGPGSRSGRKPGPESTIL